MVTSKTSDRAYDFTLELAAVTEVDTAVEDALYEAGCDDATLVVQTGRVRLHFSRTAASLDVAVQSALHDIRRAGFEVAEPHAAVSPPPAS